MGADRIFRRFRDLLDVTFGSPADGDVVQYDAGTNKIVLAPPSGAPSGPAGGDLAGTYPDPVIANGAVTIPQLAFDPATQGELDIEAAARAAADAGLQPLDSDLTAIAALSTSAFGRGLLTLANQAALLAAAGAAAAVHVHAGEDITSGTVADARIASTIARDSEVTSAISALSSVYQPLDSDLTAIAALSSSAYGRSFLILADAAAARTLIGAASQTDLDAHIADTSDAHDASAVSYDPTASGLASTDVQDAIDEVAAGGSPTGAAGGVLDGTYPNPGLASGVAGAGLAETADVLSVNVDGATLEINADSLRVKADGITAAQIAADAVGSSEIAANAVGSSELADGAVDTAALQDSSVTSVKIADGTIAIGDLAFDPATQAELDAMIASAVILAPAASSRNIIQPTAGAVIAAIVRAHAAQSVDLMQWQTSLGAPLVSVGLDGKVGLGSRAGAAIQPLDIEVILNPQGDNDNNIQGTGPKPIGYGLAVRAAFPVGFEDFDAEYAALATSLLTMTDTTRVGSAIGHDLFVAHRGTRSAAASSALGSLFGQQIVVQDYLAGADPTGTVDEMRGQFIHASHGGRNKVGNLYGQRIDFDAYNSVTPVGAVTGVVKGQYITGGVFDTISVSELTFQDLRNNSDGAATLVHGLKVRNMGWAGAVTSYGIRVLAQSGSGTTYGLVVEGGKSVFMDALLIAVIAAPADAVFANGQGGWWWDQANSLPKWKGKTSGGVVVNFIPTSQALLDAEAAARAAADALLQPLDSDLTAVAGLTPTNDDVIQRKAGAWANRTLAQLIADLAALGTTFQPLDSDLSAFAGLAIAADKLPYGTGSHTLGLADFTAAGRALVDDADASAQRTTLGLGTVATLASDTDTALAANSDTRVATQKAVKAYVDAVAVGLAIKQSCRVATAAALPTNTYLAGVITETGNGALTVDGVAVANADRVLVKDEVAGLKNGIYTVTDKGSAGTPFVLTRSTDMNTAAEVPGAFSFVEDGTVNSGAGFVVASSGPFTIGTTAITWTQFSGAGEITAGTGLGKSGNTISITDAELLALAGLVSAADKLAYFTGSGTAALADFTAAGRALVDDADAAAQRTTLGLGTLATKSTIATADISAGAVTEAKQTLADNTTGDVSTSAHGYAPKAPNDATKVLDGTGAYSVPQVEESDQQAGVMVPTIPGWVGINGSFTAKRANFTRFTLLKNRTISSIKFRSNTAGTGNIDVCIIDSSGNILRSSGSVSGKKGANTWQTVNLTSSLALTAGTVYYVGIMTDTSDGTYDAVFWNVSTGIGLDQMWGSTLGLLQSFFKDITNFPFASQTVTVGTANGAVGPIAGLI